MKSLFKIISRYSVTAGMIIGVILISNIAVFVAVGYHNMVSAGAPDFKRSALESVGKEFYQENDTWQLSDTGRQDLNMGRLYGNGSFLQALTAPIQFQ